MRFLLDTNAILWWLGDARRLTRGARDAITGADGIFVSAVTVMEVAIGKMRVTVPPAEEFIAAVEASGFRILAFDAADAIALSALPSIHGDPFDRAIAAQAKRRGLTLMTADAALAQYPIAVYRL